MKSQIQYNSSVVEFSLIKRTRIQLFLLLTLFIFSYFKAFSSLVNSWLTRDDYSHGFLIPFISLYFVCSEKERLNRIPIQPNILCGLILMLFGSFALLMGNLGSVSSIQQISIMMVIPGIVLMLLGTNYLIALLLPIGYLVFMIPAILDILIGNMHWHFQVFGAIAAERLLNFINIPVARNVNFLELPNITLEVANECSGVRYLVSIIALAIPLAIFTHKNWRKRLLLISIALIIGIILNPVRIFLIGIWGYYGGSITHGPMHIFQGMFVSVAGFILLLFSAWLLAKTSFSETKKYQLESENITTKKLLIDQKRFNLALFFSFLVFFTLSFYLYVFTPNPVLLKTDINSIPLEIGEWKGKDSHIPETFNIQGADLIVSRIYRNPSGREIKLYIGYFELQRQGKEFINYTLQRLYDNTKEVSIPLDNNKIIHLNRAVIKDKFKNSMFLYWYDLKGQVITNNYKAKFNTAINGLLHRRTNGAIIMVSSNLDNRADIDKLMDDEGEFIQKIIPILKGYFI